MTKKSWHQNFNRAPKEQRTGPDGFVYDSKTEMVRGCYLQQLERIGEISELERQRVYKLECSRGLGCDPITVIAGKKIAIYKPDFVYKDKSGIIIIEDVKGYRDEASKFRIRVFEAFYDKKVIIIRKSGARWIAE